MKRILLSVFAAALAFAIAPAQAAEQGVKLGVGGYYKNAFGVVADRR